MAESLGEAVLTLRTDDSRLDGGIDRAERRSQALADSFDRTGQRISRAGDRLSVAVTAPLTAIAYTSVQAARESREAMGQVEAALASMGNASGRTQPQLEAAARELQGLSTFDDDDILRDVTANMLTFGSVAEEEFDRAQLAAVNLSARLGQDLQTSAMQLGRALNDPIQGITALRRTGIQFSDAQEAMIRRMVETGDVAGAQRVILGELERQFAGSAAAMRAAAPDQATTDQWREFQETIGEAILTALPHVTSALGGLLGAFNSLSPGMQQFLISSLAVGAALGPVLSIGGRLISLLAFAVPPMIAFASGLTGIGVASGVAATGATAAGIAMRGFAASLLGSVRSGIARLIPLIFMLGRALMALALNPVGLVIMAIAAAVMAVYYAWQNWDQIVAIFDRVKTAIGAWWNENVQPILDAVGGKIAEIIEWFRSMPGRIGTALAELYNGVRTWIQDRVGAALAWIGERIQAVIGFFGNLATNAIGAVRRLYEGIREWLVDKFNDLVDLVMAPIRAISDGFGWLYDQVVGNSWVPDMIDEIGRQFARLDAVMVRPALDAADQVNDAFAGIQPPAPLPSVPPASGEGPAGPSELGEEAAEAANPGAPANRAAWVDGFRDTFTEGIKAALAGDGGSALSRFFENVGDKTLTNLLNALFGMAGNALAGLTSGAGEGSFLGILGGTLATLFGGGGDSGFAGGFATGGLIPRGGFGIVGERGPEPVFATAQGAMVLPNRSLQGGGLGGGVTINFNGPVHHPEQVRRSAAQAGAAIARAAAAGQRGV